MRQWFKQKLAAPRQRLISGDAAPATEASLTSGDNLNLRTLINLRWLAILGQSLLVLTVAYGFGYHFNLWLCLGIISASVWLNLILLFSGQTRRQLRDWEAALQLSFDALQLAALLGATGGLNNPFCLMLVAPATVAAANLPTRYGAGVVIVSVLATCALVFWSLPLPWAEGDTFSLPHVYRLGFLAAILIGIVFTAGYAWQAALEARRMEQALNATRAVLEKEHRLSALGGLAAAAAHELGTPLGTIQVVAREMLRSLKPSDPLHEDAELLVSQSQRCRDILKNLSQKPETRDQVYDQMPLRAFLEEVARPYRGYDKAIHITVTAENLPEDEDAGTLISIKRRPEWLHALRAFVENAIDFAASEVWIRVEIYEASVSLSVEDDGPGFSPEILSRLGGPYVSTRQVDGRVGTGGGMGLGFFIAKTLCEHTGATVRYGNRDAGGAYVRLLWQRDEIDIVWDHVPTPTA
ncbi:ActS/PrrB/RegB family redox-sensitive histidine kinase [Asticcacaulis tiandongensis]|uniref:ActS/PrrB/RegB family redox-sensitive histidine kinase n=1 Tax=Asticcacaulis tiandongensis TaxID=2565365 RepID=UPI001FEBC3C7|nr:ActS/PrrB/RegB family redox-sensitive histidine kinase [Asticcacaulis tiandongensis]